jgi:hypothetical protein
LATGWTVRGLNPGGGEIFRACPDRSLGTPNLLYNGYRVFTGGKDWPGRDADPSPPSSAVGHESVKLYLYSPCGPYGLFGTSVYVQGCTLPFTSPTHFQDALVNAKELPVYRGKNSVHFETYTRSLMLNFYKFRTFSSCSQYDVFRLGEGTMRHVICRVPVRCCLSKHFST